METLQAGQVQQVGFVQLQKYNADTGEFVGVMASEAPDHSGEIFDYDASKPHFKAWANHFMEVSGGRSLGNVREMHSLKAAGKLVELTFDDVGKRMPVRGKIVDSESRQKAAEGVFTGLSIGGTYKRRWPDASNPNLMRYEAVPSEVSLVDNPCNPDATLEVLSGGSRKVLKFAAPAAALDRIAVPFEEDAVPPELHVVKGGKANEPARPERGAAYERLLAVAKRHALPVGETSQRVLKSLYDVGGLASLVCSVDSLRACLASEAEYEGDDSPLPGRLLQIQAELAQILKELVVEEADELLARAGITKGITPMNVAELRASITSLEKQYEEVERMYKAATHDEVKEKHHSTMEALHEKMAEAHGKMADHYKGDPHDDGAETEAEKARKAEAAKAAAAGAPLTEDRVAEIAANAIAKVLGEILKPEAPAAAAAPVAKGAPAPLAVTPRGGAVLTTAADDRFGKGAGATEADAEAEHIEALKARIAKGADSQSSAERADAEAAQRELAGIASKRFALKAASGGVPGWMGARESKVA